MTDEHDVDHERWRKHYRADDGWMHCDDEVRGPTLNTPGGTVVEIRCPHYPDPLRYEPA